MIALLLVLREKVQIIFRDTGFYLNKNDIRLFLKSVLTVQRAEACKQCSISAGCRSILLKTPSSKVELAVSSKELEKIEDLLQGLLFYLSLRSYVFLESLN